MQTIKALPIAGPIAVTVTIHTGSGDSTQTVTLTENLLGTSASLIGSGMVDYQASKLARAALRNVASQVVKAAGIEDPSGQVTRATANGQDFILKTAEEIDAEFKRARELEAQLQTRVVRSIEGAVVSFTLWFDDRIDGLLRFLSKLEAK